MAAKIKGTAGKLNLTIEQGSTFSIPITWKDSDGNAIDNSGYTARMQLRDNITDVTPIIELTTENSRISLGGADGVITLLISAADTESLNFTSAIYDLEMVSAGIVTRLLEGNVSLDKEVTR